MGRGQATLEYRKAWGEGEQRWLAIGLIDAVAATVIVTRRGNAVRIISLRRARHGERAEYQKLFSR
jgi:uncharacterized DUF497 family protein